MKVVIEVSQLMHRLKVDFLSTQGALPTKIIDSRQGRLTLECPPHCCIELGSPGCFGEDVGVVVTKLTASNEEISPIFVGTYHYVGHGSLRAAADVRSRYYHPDPSWNTGTPFEPTDASSCIGVSDLCSDAPSTFTCLHDVSDDLTHLSSHGEKQIGYKRKSADVDVTRSISNASAAGCFEALNKTTHGSDEKYVSKCESGDGVKFNKMSPILLADIHLDTLLIQRGCLTERRAKYLDGWSSTFLGTFRINPPTQARVKRGARWFQGVDIPPFEFFLWSNVEPQPTVDFIKKMISAATKLRTGEFRLETVCGQRLEYNQKALDAFRQCLKSGSSIWASGELIYKQPVVDLCIVLVER